MNISQIFLTDSEDKELPAYFQYAISTIDKAFPSAVHTIYDKVTLRAFIANNYAEDVLWAYDTLCPYAYKADLGRYCLLNKLGGWYFDIAIRMVNPVNIGTQIRFLAFRDIQRLTCTSWACSNAILYSQSDNHGLQMAIEMIVENCKKQYYGITPLCPTGPALLGKALAANDSQPDFIYGDVIELTPTYKQKNKAFVLSEGTIMAWNKPSGGGDLAGLGANGVNNYNELWVAKQVYANK